MIDTRPPLADLLSAFDALVAAGWQVRDIASQPAPGGGVLPIRAYFNADEVDTILVGGIHGREPAGPMALARSVPRLVELGRDRRLLVMPLLNPWGYLQRQRYGPSGQSVSDSDHVFGRTPAPACPEAGDITRFVMKGIRIRPGAAVLDLHEDPVYEAPDYHYEGVGSYLYVIGEGAIEHPVSRRVWAYLRHSPLPLVRDGVTRFGEAVVNGVDRGQRGRLDRRAVRAPARLHAGDHRREPPPRSGNAAATGSGGRVRTGTGGVPWQP